MKDHSVHRRGRRSEYSNKLTYGSQVRYLPGSVKDEGEIVVPTASIRISKYVRVISSQSQ